MPLPSRRSVGQIDRNNKLMSVLAARRHALVRDRWRVGQTKEIVSIINTRLQQQLQHQTERSVSNCGDQNCLTNNFKGNNQSEVVEDNTIINNKDEILDMEESSNGVFILSSIDKYETTNMASTKELNTNTKSNSLNVDDKSPPDPLTTTTTTNSPQREIRYTIRPKRIEMTKIRIQTTPTPDRSTSEEIDLNRFSYYGQKINALKQNDSRNQIITMKRTRNGSISKDRMKDDSEILEMSVSRQTSTEKSKFWNNRINSYSTRNLVALGNAIRRGGSGFVTQTKLEPVVNIQLTTPLKPITQIETTTSNHDEISVMHTELIDLTEKVMVQRSTANSTKPVEPNITATTTYVPPPMIINVPDDDSIVVDASYPPPILTQPADGEISTFISSITEPIQLEVTTALIVEDEDSRTFLPVPDINHLFANISTEPEPQENLTTKPLTTVFTTSSTLSTSKKPVYTTLGTTTTTAKPTTTTTTTTTTTAIPTTLRTTTTTTTTPIPTTTITTTTTTTTKRPILTTKKYPKTTRQPIVISTTQKTTIEILPTNETIISFQELFNLSSIFANFPSKVPPPLIDFASIVSSSDILSTRKPIIDNVYLNRDDEVTIEVHRMNMATYVLAGLGMLPIVVILLYVVKSIIFKKQNKVTSDLERYIQDGQPISPVVRLEQSETSSVTDESTVTECDFNRNNLRFKNVLGEGNFGQVWKAEADDLIGHFGTTRIVAVKAERSNRQGGLKEEAEIMRKLGSHSNVVTLLGACIERGIKKDSIFFIFNK